MSGIQRLFEVLRKSQLAKAQEPKKANWSPLSDEHINQEYEWEYPHVKRLFGDIWPTVEHFRQAVKSGTVTPISPDTDSRMTNRSHSSSIDQLKGLVSTYRFPRDVDRIARGLQAGDKMPTPIVLRHPKTGQMHIMSGNTRMDTANILGYQPHATIVDMPAVEQPKKTGLDKSDESFGWRRLFDCLKSESEHLEKGAMKRFKYDPEDRPIAVDKKLYNWQAKESKHDRELLPHMKGNARERALHKLAGKTRSVYTDKGRYFLLHRGMGRDEHAGTVNSEKGTVHHPETRSSWTPDYKVARDFSQQYGNSAGLTSAWVHENDIVTVPRQYGDYAKPEFGYALKPKAKWPKEHKVRSDNDFEDEWEVVLRRGHNSHLTRPSFRDLPNDHRQHTQDLHNRINMRGKLDPREPLDNPELTSDAKQRQSEINQTSIKQMNRGWANQRKITGLNIGAQNPTQLPDNVRQLTPKNVKEPKAPKKPKV